MSRERAILTGQDTGAALTTLKWSQLAAHLIETQDLKCQDPCDKLFALLGLFGQPTPRLLRVSYLFTTGGVFANLMVYLLTEVSSELLAYASGWSVESFASWAIDWRKSLRARLPGSPYTTHGAASAGLIPGRTSTPLHLVRIGTFSITIRGMVVSHAHRVKTLGSGPPDEMQRQLYDALEWVCRTTERHQSKRQDLQASVRRFGRTIAAPLRRLSQNTSARDDKSPKGDSRRSTHGIGGYPPRIRRLVYNIRPETERESYLPPEAPVAILNIQKDLQDPDQRICCFADADDDEAGIAWASVQAGDAVCMLVGFKRLYILRPHKHGWIVKSECVYSRYMDGELFRELDTNSLYDKEPQAPLQDFLLL